MELDLNLAQPFIILTLRHWKGWDAVNCPNKSAVTQSWCQKWNTGQAYFNPTSDLKHVVVIIFEPRYKSHPSPTIHNTCNEMLEGSSCCEILESIQKILHLGVQCRGLEPKLSPLSNQKPRCGDAYTWWSQISTLHDHSLYLHWDIGRVEMLWIARISPKSLNLCVKSGIQAKPTSTPPMTQNTIWWSF